MLRYFLYQDSSSHKFWQVEQVGAQLLIGYGKADTAGQRQTKTFASAEAAAREAQKLTQEKLRKGYQETAAPGPSPTPPAPLAAAAPAATGLLQTDKVAGKRIKLAKEFRHFQLGSPADLKRVLEAHGATVVSSSAQNFDFYLGSTDLVAAYPGEVYRQPVVFEEELLATPLAVPPEGPFAGLRALVLAQCRVLLAHPNIRVTRLALGQPLSAAELQARLGQPIPAYLQAFYQQVGELCLLWQYRFPFEGICLRDEGQEAPVHTWNIDEDDNHAGSIQLLPLASVLFGDWFNPGYGFDLQPTQRILDFYSEYSLTAVELGSEADPLLYLGSDYGVSFHDDPPIRFSDYVSLVLHTFGLRDRSQFWTHTVGGRYEPGTAEALAGLAHLDLPNPFGIILAGSSEPLTDATELAELLDEYSEQGLEGHFFWLLDYALQHQKLVLADYEALATNPRYHRRARYRALQASQLPPNDEAGEVELEYDSYASGPRLNMARPTLRDTFKLRNRSGKANELLGYHLKIVANFEAFQGVTQFRKSLGKQEVVLHEHDSEQNAQYQPLHDGTAAMQYQSAQHGVQQVYWRRPELPLKLPARKVEYIQFFTHDVDVLAQLQPYGIVTETALPDGSSYYSLTYDCTLKVLLTVRLARENPSGPLRGECFIRESWEPSEQ